MNQNPISAMKCFSIHTDTYIVWHSHTLCLEEEGSGNSRTNKLCSVAGIPEIISHKNANVIMNLKNMATKISDIRIHEWQRCFGCVTTRYGSIVDVVIPLDMCNCVHKHYKISYAS